MRFYLKLGFVLLAFLGLRTAAGGSREHLRDALFVARCGVAEWIGDHGMREQLVYEGQLELRR